MDCWVFLEIFPRGFRENLAILPRGIIINPPSSQSPHPQSIFIPFSITKTNILTQVINYTFFPYQYYEYLITINNIEMKFILCIAFFNPFSIDRFFITFLKLEFYWRNNWGCFFRGSYCLDFLEKSPSKTHKNTQQTTPQNQK
jgi:hypothetical protein